MSTTLVVAIDGPSGAGKSTAGRALAAQLAYTYIDTGAMYRALALKASRKGVSLDAEEALASLLRASSIQLTEGGRRVLLDTYDVTADIRSREAMNEIWSAWTGGQNAPARACVEAKLADARMSVEIGVVAAK